VSATPAPPVPQPAPGSAHSFLLLYTPRPRRTAVRTLLALADEIGAGLGRQLDHEVAHVRLQWWREELQRFAEGVAAHPWLIAWQHQRHGHADGGHAQHSGGAPPELTPPPDLTPLADAAAIDLASAHLAAVAARRLPQALFVLIAQVLTAGIAAAAALTAEQERAIGELGRQTDALLHPAEQPARPPDTAPPAAVPAPPPAPALAPALWPPLTPLLVCAALAARQAHRRSRRGGNPPANSDTMRPALWALLADNIAAWRVARAAHRGRLQLEELTNGTGSS
jgi:hypothetical protein